MEGEGIRRGSLEKEDGKETERKRTLGGRETLWSRGVVEEREGERVVERCQERQSKRREMGRWQERERESRARGMDVLEKRRDRLWKKRKGG